MCEEDSILLRRIDEVVDTGPDEHHCGHGEMDNQLNQNIEMPQIHTLTKLQTSLFRYSGNSRREPPRSRNPCTLIGAVVGKSQRDDRPGGDTDKDVQGEAITK